MKYVTRTQLRSVTNKCYHLLFLVTLYFKVSSVIIHILSNIYLLHVFTIWSGLGLGFGLGLLACNYT